MNTLNGQRVDAQALHLALAGDVLRVLLGRRRRTRRDGQGRGECDEHPHQYGSRRPLGVRVSMGWGIGRGFGFSCWMRFTSQREDDRSRDVLHLEAARDHL